MSFQPGANVVRKQRVFTAVTYRRFSGIGFSGNSKDPISITNQSTFGQRVNNRVFAAKGDRDDLS